MSSLTDRRDVATTGRMKRTGRTKEVRVKWQRTERKREMKKEALNLCVKTDDFPFNTPLSSLLSSVLSAAVEAPQLPCFHNNNPQIIQPHARTHTYS